MSDQTAYLLTGFPNFRGKKMLAELLAREPECCVFAVVRSKFQTEAVAALAELPPEHQRRVELLEGDAAAMDLGLSGQEYRDLAGRVTNVHHLAQAMYPGVSREMAEEINIGAMREIVEFGRVCRQLSSVVVHSSAMVSGNRTGLVLESELNRGQSFRTDVEETLARAERVAQRAMQHMPISVVRPTQIVGDSRSGEVDRFDGPYLLILLLVTSQKEFPVLLPTRGDAPMHLVPIDYVTAAAWHIGKNPRAVGRTFHIADPRPLSVRRVFELVAESGGRKLPGGFIPTNLTRALLRTPGLSMLAKSPRAFVELIATPVRYDTHNSEELLSGTGVACPPFESYVDEIVSYVRRRVEERRKPREPEVEVEDPLA